MITTLLVIFSVILALAGLYLFVQGFIIRRRVLNEMRPIEVLDQAMPNWSILLRGIVEQGPHRASFLLREIAESLASEMAFLLAPSREVPEVWTIPEGWIYSEKEFPTNLSISSKAGIIEKALSEESVALDTEIGDTIPEPLAKSGVESAIVAAVGYPKPGALLVVCNSKKLVGRPPFQVRYTVADVDLAVATARVISRHRAGKFIHKKITEVEPMVEDPRSEDAWSREKEELLKTHPGWFVAYQDGKRVALEPSLNQLVAALDEKLGTPRKPCEFHEITERPAVQRGPSPRLWPVRTGE